MHSLASVYITPATLASGNVNTDLPITMNKFWDSSTMYLSAVVTTPDDTSVRLTSGYIGYVQK